MSDRQAETVGIIGLGIMGLAIARNILRAKIAVRGYDIDAVRLQMLRDAGGVATKSAADAASGAAIVLTSLPSVEALDRTVESLLGGRFEHLVVAELSTLPIEVKERARARLAASGMTLLDCPLSGTGSQA